MPAPPERRPRSPTPKSSPARLQQELETDRATLESANADVASAQQELQQRQQEASAAAASLIEVERQQEAAAQLRSCRPSRRLPPCAIASRKPKSALPRSNARSKRLQDETTAAQQQLESFGGQRGQLGLEFESASQRVNALDVADHGHPPATGRQARRRNRSQASSRFPARRSTPALMGKKGSLEGVIAEHGYATESVRKLFTSGSLQGGRAPAGVLADFLEVEDRYEHVVDDFLRDELNYIVVKSWDAADEGLRLLRTDVDGRATFLVHPEDSQAKFSFDFDEVANHVTHSDAVVPLKNCIRVLDGFGKSLEVILPKLGNGYIVPDPEVGRNLALENPDAFFLSQSGECFHNVTVTGGKQRSQGPLSMKRELRDVLLQMGELERAMGEKETYIAALGRDIAELTGLLQRLEDEKRESERQAMTSEHTLRQLESEMTRVRERLSTYERELQRVGEERSEREEFITSQLGELFQHEERQRGLEAEMQAAQSSLESLRPAPRRGRATGQRSSRQCRYAGRAAPRSDAHGAAHRSDAVGSIGAPGEAEIAAGVGSGRKAAARRRECSPGGAGRRAGQPSARSRSSAIANCRKNCRRSASASSSWKRR